MSYMRTITILVILTSSLYFSSCTDKIKTDIIVFKALDESLVNSNTEINNQTETILASLEDKLADPRTVEKAKLWYPKAQLIQKLSKDLYGYIEALKLDLKREAGLKNNDGVETFRESDKNSVVRLLDKKGLGKDLYEHLKEYKKNLLSVDPELNNVFVNTIVLTTSTFDSANNGQAFTKIFFDDIPVIAALAMLSKFQNNIRVTENKMTEFCHDQLASLSIHWWPTPIVFSNINYTKPGQTIKITAGIVNFTSSLNTEITIFKKRVPVNEYGVGIYEFKASETPGKHNLPVEISYSVVDGNKKTITKIIEYTVAQ